MRSLRDTDRASSRGSLLLVGWLVEREVRPAVVVVVVVVVMTVVVEEEEEKERGREDLPEGTTGKGLFAEGTDEGTGELNVLWSIFMSETVVVVSDVDDCVATVVVAVVTVEITMLTSDVNEGLTVDMVVDETDEWVEIGVMTAGL